MFKSTSSPFSKHPEDYFSSSYEPFDAYSHQRLRNEFSQHGLLKLEHIGDFSPLTPKSNISPINDDKYDHCYNFLQDHYHQEMDNNCDLSFQTQFPEELEPLSIYASEEEETNQQQSPNLNEEILIESPYKPFTSIEKIILSSPFSQRHINFDTEATNVFQSSTSRKDDMNDYEWPLLSFTDECLNLKQALQNEVKLESRQTRSTKQVQKPKTSPIIRPLKVTEKEVSTPKKQSNLSNKSKKISKTSRSTSISSQTSTTSPLLSSSSSFHDKQNQIEGQLTRKIVKNFGKAIAAFACSSNAKPLLMQFVRNDLKKYSKFLQFVYEIKDTIEGNRRLKLLLQHQDEDNLQTKQNKDIFRHAAEIFMQGHVYKWLWNSHVENKALHSKLIGQVRIRIQNPDRLDNLTN